MILVVGMASVKPFPPLSSRYKDLVPDFPYSFVNKFFSRGAIYTKLPKARIEVEPYFSNFWLPTLILQNPPLVAWRRKKPSYRVFVYGTNGSSG